MADIAEGSGAGPGSRHVSRPLAGMALLAASVVVMAGMDAIGKLLSSRIPVVELIFLRHVFYLLCFLPVALARGGPALLATQLPGLQILRGLLVLGSATFFFAAIARMPIADALAIFFIYPFVVTLAAWLLLGETLGPWRIGAVVAGFAGALVAIGPGAAILAPGVPFAIAAGFCFAGALVATRRIAGRDPVLATLAISGLVAMMTSGLAMPLIWVAPGPSDWPLIVLMGVIAAAGNAGVILAHRFAPAGVLAPFGYAEIVGAVFFGYSVFGDFPAPHVWAGIALIVASGLVIAWREGRSSRQLTG